MNNDYDLIILHQARMRDFQRERVNHAQVKEARQHAAETAPCPPARKFTIRRLLGMRQRVNLDCPETASAAAM